MMKLLGLVLIMILITGCTPESKDLKIIKNHCLTKMNKTEKFCGCMVVKSEKNLTQNQLEYISNNFLGNRKEAVELKAKMSLDEFNRIGDFLTIAIQSCAAEE